MRDYQAGFVETQSLLTRNTVKSFSRFIVEKFSQNRIRLCVAICVALLLLILGIVSSKAFAPVPPLPATAPNLTPYQPTGWTDKIVISPYSSSFDSSVDTRPLLTTDTLHVNWAVINNGNAATGARYYVKLYVDGAEKNTWYSDPPLNVNYYNYVQDYFIGHLSAGTHA